MPIPTQLRKLVESRYHQRKTVFTTAQQLQELLSVFGCYSTVPELQHAMATSGLRPNEVIPLSLVLRLLCDYGAAARGSSKSSRLALPDFAIPTAEDEDVAIDTPRCEEIAESEVDAQAQVSSTSSGLAAFRRAVGRARVESKVGESLGTLPQPSAASDASRAEDRSVRSELTMTVIGHAARLEWLRGPVTALLRARPSRRPNVMDAQGELVRQRAKGPRGPTVCDPPSMVLREEEKMRSLMLEFGIDLEQDTTKVTVNNNRPQSATGWRQRPASAGLVRLPSSGSLSATNTSPARQREGIITERESAAENMFVNRIARKRIDAARREEAHRLHVDRCVRPRSAGVRRHTSVSTPAPAPAPLGKSYALRVFAAHRLEPVAVVGRFGDLPAMLHAIVMALRPLPIGHKLASVVLRIDKDTSAELSESTFPLVPSVCDVVVATSMAPSSASQTQENHYS